MSFKNPLLVKVFWLVTNMNEIYEKEFNVDIFSTFWKLFYSYVNHKNKYHWQASYVTGPGVISLETLKRFDTSTNKVMEQDFYKADWPLQVLRENKCKNFGHTDIILRFVLLVYKFSIKQSWTQSF